MSSRSSSASSALTLRPLRAAITRACLRSAGSIATVMFCFAATKSHQVQFHVKYVKVATWSIDYRIQPSKRDRFGGQASFVRGPSTCLDADHSKDADHVPYESHNEDLILVLWTEPMTFPRGRWKTRWTAIEGLDACKHEERFRIAHILEVVRSRKIGVKPCQRGMLWLNPSDNQGVRFLLPQVQTRKPWIAEK